MRGAILLLATALGAGAVQAQEPPQPAPDAAGQAAGSPWTFSATGYWNMPRQSGDYLSGIFIAERKQLHLEARSNYEAVHSQSAFIGWTFSGGEAIQFKATPIVGFVGGSTHGLIGGLEASVAVSKFDYYIEAEYLDARGEDPGYLYAWSELGFRPVEWLRLGLVAQRTRIYGGDRELQRGGFFQVTVRRFTAGFYWFNPGSTDQVAILSLGVSF
ncbi:hypothetical protein JJQ59_12395 [Cupriavidus necator]|uniref:Cellulose biosynthesis protein BcsS n=1 Tax=Cupriavidus necator TaxID=106590 RepID=A0A367PL80_CUPNE|nr:hypothetical protein [Cupriavidus necator]QQX83233.1 hypothetical protein JJQ59_12395 [Cupriavidus necator]RCJ07766.1 hypothetical protein DDK22_14415 [Cupriavidus necator]